MTQATDTQFAIGINPIYPGEKLQDGDRRWGEHTSNFTAKAAPWVWVPGQ